VRHGLLARAIDVLLAIGGVALLALVVMIGSGQLSWVITTGNSMSPRVAAGDLIVVRPADRYRVGDVVAYDSPDLGRKVLHRIVAVEGGRFVTQGDHNDWVDSYQPTPAEVVGREQLHLPGVGRHLRSLLDPGVVAVIVGLATALALGMLGRVPVPEEGEAWVEHAV